MLVCDLMIKTFDWMNPLSVPLHNGLNGGEKEKIVCLVIALPWPWTSLISWRKTLTMVINDVQVDQVWLRSHREREEMGQVGQRCCGAWVPFLSSLSSPSPSPTPDGPLLLLLPTWLVFASCPLQLPNQTMVYNYRSLYSLFLFKGKYQLHVLFSGL